MSIEKVGAGACTTEQKPIQRELAFAGGQTVQPDGTVSVATMSCIPSTNDVNSRRCVNMAGP